ncbi:MAG: fibronectin type III domain-containing protein [Calditrichaeota bacterium]|nr:fibronectin type III domain-containing protein [Calditrichota bacterium]
MQAARANTKMRIVLWGIIFIFCFSTSFAAQVIVSWSPNSEPDLQGYRIYYGLASRNYTKIIDVGQLTTYTVLNLAENTNYYFAVTAYDNAGNESGYSEEVQIYIPPSDTDPPRITNVDVLDKTYIKIFFSETIDRSTAEDAGNYRISPGVNVLSAELLSDLSSVKLTTSIHNPGAYRVTVNNIKDKATVPNTIAANSFFDYVVLDTDSPQLAGVQAISETQVDVIFSEPVQKSAAENIGNYSINHNISIFSARLDADLRTVHLTTSTHSENTYTLTVNHIFVTGPRNQTRLLQIVRRITNMSTASNRSSCAWMCFQMSN